MIEKPVTEYLAMYVKKGRHRIFQGRFKKSAIIEKGKSNTVNEVRFN